MRALLVGLALLGASAWAHTLAPEEVVASLATPAARVATGVERIAQDRRNPRVLVIRVGSGWFALSREARAAAAASWYDTWRHTVLQGVVAVLDARSERVVVHYGRGGAVVGLRDDA